MPAAGPIPNFKLPIPTEQTDTFQRDTRNALEALSRRQGIQGDAGVAGGIGPTGPLGPPGTNGTNGVDFTIGLLSYIDEGPVTGFPGGYKEIVGLPFPSSVTWYTNAAKTNKIVERLITRNAEQSPTVIVWHFYQPDGITIAQTATDTIGLSGVFEQTRTRVNT